MEHGLRRYEEELWQNAGRCESVGRLDGFKRCVFNLDNKSIYEPNKRDAKRVFFEWW